jgi:uncharacterized membrane protein
MPGSSSAVPVRRRPASARVTIGALLLALATAVGLVALAAGSKALLVAALVTALLSGWLVLRLACTELRLLRRHSARDRAWQAVAFREHVTRTAAEHTTFATTMTRRLAGRDREVRELEGTLRLSEARADAAEARVRREVRRVDDARSRIVELEVALAIRRAEEADELATWEPGGPEVDTVVDLLAWEDRARSGAGSDSRRLRRHA